MKKKEYLCPLMEELSERCLSDVILASLNDGDNFIGDDLFNDDLV